MEKVTGIGGLFFRAKNPEGLSCWYSEHLGVLLTPTNYEDSPWRQESGPTVLNPFPEETEYFGDRSKSWMINFRVRSLDSIVRQLHSAGIKVTFDPESYPNARFARLCDPGGNPIELLEPQG
jgi:glyoxylase I family protein